MVRIYIEIVCEVDQIDKVVDEVKDVERHKLGFIEKMYLTKDLKL